MSTVEISSSEKLSYLHFGSIDAQKIVVFLHGIMGNKKNLQSFVQKFVAQNVGTGALIFDLPNHGESTKLSFAPTLEECAHRIQEALEVLKIRPYAFVGHSFGAKVALLCAARYPDVASVFLLDAAPGSYRAALSPNITSLNAVTLIEMLVDLSWPMASRQDVMSSLINKGAPKEVAMWMTTNLEAVPGGLKLSFEPVLIRKMLDNFFVCDLWPVVYEVGQRSQVHLVAAQNGGRLAESDAQKISTLPENRGFFHRLENAGHFLHSDNPEGLLAILQPYFT